MQLISCAVVGNCCTVIGKLKWREQIVRLTDTALNRITHLPYAVIKLSISPYNNPEISIASAIELAGSGTSTADITASIIDYYYSNNTDEPPAQQTGTLLD